MVTTTTGPTIELETVTAGHEVSESRKASLREAIDLGADLACLVLLRDARRLAKRDTVKIPPHRFENLSRGKGWCRKGRGASAVWGEREDGEYRVGPGRWTCGASDGFSRKGEDIWDVTAVKVGSAVWTIAN